MIKSIKKGILFGLIVTFVFGQLPSLIFHLAFQTQMPIRIVDLLVGLYLLITIFSDKRVLSVIMSSFIGKVAVVLSFTLILGSVMLGVFEAENALYLVRFISYLSFGYLLWYEKILNKKEVVSFILVTGVCVATIGVIQYFLFADMRALKILGWDDHYFRLTAPFLDPAFTGIVLVLSVLSVFFFWKSRSVSLKVIVLLFILGALLLTYSRASYLSLVAALAIYGLMRQKIQLWLFLFAALFIGSIFVVPRPNGSEGVKLERTFSIILKAKNAREVSEIFMKYPLFGVGYNNLCTVISSGIATQTTRYSHSCSGADNSFILILATTGVVGGLILLWGGVLGIKGQSPEMIALLSAVLVHTQFTNTLFYPWVLLWIGVVGSVFFKKRT